MECQKCRKTITFQTSEVNKGLCWNCSYQKNDDRSGVFVTPSPEDFVDEEDGFDLEPKKVHPKAREVLKEDFFWDITDELSPFGNDDGWDTMTDYHAWRLENPSADPHEFLEEQLDGWNVNNDNWDIKTADEIGKELQADEFSFLTRDNTIIALAFAQIVFDGIIDEQIKQKAVGAIERQQTDVVLNHQLMSEHHEEWKRRLRLMKQILDDFR